MTDFEPLDTPLGPIAAGWTVVHAREVSVTHAITQDAPISLLVSDDTIGVLVTFDTAERALAIGLAMVAEARDQLGLAPPRLAAVPPGPSVHDPYEPGL